MTESHQASVELNNRERTDKTVRKRDFLTCSLFLDSDMLLIATQCKTCILCVSVRASLRARWPDRQWSWMFMETQRGLRKLDPRCIIHQPSSVTAIHTHAHKRMHAPSLRRLYAHIGTDAQHLCFCYPFFFLSPHHSSWFPYQQSLEIVLQERLQLICAVVVFALGLLLVVFVLLYRYSCINPVPGDLSVNVLFLHVFLFWYLDISCHDKLGSGYVQFSHLHRGVFKKQNLVYGLLNKEVRK